MPLQVKLASLLNQRREKRVVTSGKDQRRTTMILVTLNNLMTTLVRK
jgi:hypothetical protein